MRPIPAAFLALLAVFSAPLYADVLTLPTGSGTPVQADKPGKGITMAAVQRRYGAPLHKHPAVGGGHPQRPPITRWDYPAFIVFFERDHVVDSVVPGLPPAVRHVDELTSATP